MYIRKRISKGKFYWSIVESYRDGSKVKQRTIKDLGSTKNAYNILMNDKMFNKFLPKLLPFIDL